MTQPGYPFRSNPATHYVVEIFHEITQWVSQSITAAVDEVLMSLLSLLCFVVTYFAFVCESEGQVAIEGVQQYKNC
jgi:hypothetical protein